jgi:TolB-like protein
MHEFREETMKRFVRAARGLALIAALSVPATAAAQNAARPVVAVFNFDNNSIGGGAASYDGIGKGMAEFLITDLARNANVVVVDRERIQQILQEQNLIKQGAVDPETAVRVGRLVGAQYAILGGFMNDGRGTMVLTARAVNMETGVVSNPQRVQSKSDDVLALMAELSDRVSRDMKLPAIVHPERPGGSGGDRPPGDGADAGTPPVKMDLRTAMLYSKALDAQDQGDTAKATELFRQVLDKFPKYTPARTHLDKLTKNGS